MWHPGRISINKLRISKQYLQVKQVRIPQLFHIYKTFFCEVSEVVMAPRQDFSKVGSLQFEDLQ